MKTGIICVLVMALVAACAGSDRPPDAAQRIHAGARSGAPSSVCPSAPGGIIVSFDKVAYFPARARMSELVRLCPAAGDTLYDAVGWQGDGTRFPFVGAMLVAVHTRSQPDSISIDEPVMWTASGDSVRLPDGQLLPRTLGGLRTLGRTMVGDNEGYDVEWSGRANLSFPEILFKIDGTGLPKLRPARVTSIEIASDIADSEHFCSRT